MLESSAEVRAVAQHVMFDLCSVEAMHIARHAVSPHASCRNCCARRWKSPSAPFCLRPGPARFFTSARYGENARQNHTNSLIYFARIQAITPSPPPVGASKKPLQLIACIQAIFMITLCAYRCGGASDRGLHERRDTTPCRRNRYRRSGSLRARIRRRSPVMGTAGPALIAHASVRDLRITRLSTLGCTRDSGCL